MVDLIIDVVDKFQKNEADSPLPVHFYPVVLHYPDERQQIGLTDENGRLVIEEIAENTVIMVELPPVADFYRPVKREIHLGKTSQSVKIEMMGIRI